MSGRTIALSAGHGDVAKILMSRTSTQSLTLPHGGREVNKKDSLVKRSLKYNLIKFLQIFYLFVAGKLLLADFSAAEVGDTVFLTLGLGVVAEGFLRDDVLATDVINPREGP